MPGDIILLHMCTIYEDHTVYDSWNRGHDRQTFLPFYPLTICKIKILKKLKKHMEILSCYTCVP